MLNEMKGKSYDGFHFLPNPENESTVQFQFFKLKNEKGELDDPEADLENVTSIGPVYNVILLRSLSDDSAVEVCDVFEAVFSDPSVYAEGLIRADIYGTFVRKNTKCAAFWESYLEQTLLTVEEINQELMDENDDE